MSKIERFLQFAMDFKLARMCRRMSDAELQELYRTYTPLVRLDQFPPMPRKAIATMIIGAVALEIKQRPTLKHIL